MDASLTCVSELPAACSVVRYRSSLLNSADRLDRFQPVFPSADHALGEPNQHFMQLDGRGIQRHLRRIRYHTAILHNTGQKINQ